MQWRLAARGHRPPLTVALTIAGSDSSAGAGLQADLKTFSALGVFGVTAVTCVVAEVPGKVSRIDPVDTRNVRQQIELLLASFPIGAIKTGLLYSAEMVDMVATILAKQAPKIPLVVDPVMVATSGDSLLQSPAIESYQTRLFPLATLITPNLPEAAALIGRPVRDPGEMKAAGNELARKFGTGVLSRAATSPVTLPWISSAMGRRWWNFLRPSFPGFRLTAPVAPTRLRSPRGSPWAIRCWRRFRARRTSSAARSGNIFSGRHRQARSRR